VPLKARDVQAALLKKGFQKADNKDHQYFYLYTNGKKTSINTKISHGEKKIHDQNCSNMAKQMRLTNGQFRDFVQCPLTGDAYLRILIDGNHLPNPQSSKRE
jgi:predicted RNA binding protein YcfA (HicA-like mRNA interferase family)